jgi:hypothetical protein
MVWLFIIIQISEALGPIIMAKTPTLETLWILIYLCLPVRMRVCL